MIYFKGRKGREYPRTQRSPGEIAVDRHARIDGIVFCLRQEHRGALVGGGKHGLKLTDRAIEHVTHRFVNVLPAFGV